MTAAIVVVLILTGLVDAYWYTGHGGAAWLAAITLVLVVVLLVAARGGRPEGPAKPELFIVFVFGLVFTGLFWFRARAGLPGGWLSGIELTVLATLGWAWPALLLVVLYRRSGEGWRPDSRKRFAWLTGSAMLAGVFGWALHFVLFDWYDGADFSQESDHPLAVHRIITRPTETSIGLSVLGGPWQLDARPAGIIASHPADPDLEPIELDISGRILAGFTRNLSWQIQGTQVHSSDPGVMTANLDPHGRWQLQPGLPGPAIVTVSNRRAETQIGVWVTNRYGRYPPFEVITESFRIELVSVSKHEDEVHYRQVLRLRNRTDRPILGPIYAVFRTDEHPRVVIGNARRTSRIEPTGLPSIAALAARPGNRAPVIGAREPVEFEILALPALTAEWLYYNVDLIQAFDPP